MNPEEAAKLCVLVASACDTAVEPNVQLAWSMIFADTDYAAAREAVIRLKRVPAGREKFMKITTESIFDMIRTIARERTGHDVDRAEHVIPNVSPDSPREYAAELRIITSLIAEGKFDYDAYDVGGYSFVGAAPMRPKGVSASGRQWSGEAPNALTASAISQILARPPRPTRGDYTNPVRPDRVAVTATGAVVVQCQSALDEERLTD